MTENSATSSSSAPADPGLGGAAGSEKTAINALSDEFVAGMVRLSPTLATELGVPGHDDQLDDLSPAGLAAVDELIGRTVTAISAAESTGRLDDVARNVILERLVLEQDRYRSGWAHASLNVLASPLQHIRMVFDMTPTDTPEQMATFAARMRAVPASLSGYQESLRLAASRGQTSAVRQVDKCAQQCAAYAGTADEPGFFSRTVQTLLSADAAVTADLAAELAAAAQVAEQAYAELGTFLTDELRPSAPVKDAVGRERYALASREFLGAAVDLEQTYAWGWQEFLSIEKELLEVVERIAPGQDAQGAAAVLNADPAYIVHGNDGLKAWMQQLSDRALSDLGRSHFDIPEPLRRLECLIAPPGGSLGAYYTPPSDDFSRPGRMWWSVGEGRPTYTTWRETTIVYHEGVPGHHLQLATAVLRKDKLNDFQRLLAGTSGHAEGWALYAERLVRELDYLESDGDLLGMLDSQLFRAARVVVDIGMHLELTIPAGTGFHEGEVWTPELGLEFLLTRTLNEADNSRDEIDRYLGWPGQAPSYKIGERIWLEGRDAARARHGAEFDEKAFHTAALGLGGMGLDPLAGELALL